ncbi:ATP-binding protein [Trichococcus sp. K1Tr]|uniref:sensor histidine kinase n=1 Tax=Trichococcus sp. K1Tr TaxID=3020847 RepID=UPI00232E6DE5|nr:ATP-binding protein [Trichococcus sp. K1Tr]MDB6353580.1 ATP-binding protein [Trichococcus sp. K1Tr]
MFNKLKKKELSELVFEGALTLGIVYLLYIGMELMFNRLVATPPSFLREIPSLRRFVMVVDAFLTIYDDVFQWIAAIFAAIFTGWRLARRYKQMQLTHILDELHYIAAGHFDHRIDTNNAGSYVDVVDSINTLVESTVQAMAEERKIEQSKDELITNVSHDIRTPLTSIIGYLGLIEDKQFTSEEDALRYIHIAYTKALQMKVLVDDLFEYTKVRQPTTPLLLKTINIGNFLEQIVADYELESRKRHMETEVIMKTDPLMIEMDVDKMARVFNNLISNALKYAHGGTWVHIEAEKIGSEVIVAVKNNGERIPEESLQELFGRFYRVENSRSKETGGTGLGLAIAQSIVTLHGGYIYAESDEAETKFVLHLPLRQTPPVNE